MDLFDRFMPSRNAIVAAVVIFAVLIKLSLFLFVTYSAPGSKFMPDSEDYIKLAASLAANGTFAVKNATGAMVDGSLRTPGYPVFIAFFNGLLKIPLWGVVLLQVLLTLLAALVVYRAAALIDSRIALLSAVIILFDPPITIFSMILLTETLFLFMMSVFMYCVVRYLKDRSILFIVFSAMALAAATYVRPISYYLGIPMAAGIIFFNLRGNAWKAISHALLFVIIVYGLIGVWQYRNFMNYGKATFSGIEKSNLNDQGIFKSYTRNRDPYTKDMAPAPYYVNVSVRCAMSLMTRPGNFKYFRCEWLTVAGKIVAYPWMAFWLAGFLLGAFRTGRNIYLLTALLIIIYFATTSIGGVMWNVSERFRVPMMPFIALISAYGWISVFNKRRACTRIKE
jgi:hypothetical protein